MSAAEAPRIELTPPKAAAHGPDLRTITRTAAVMAWVANGAVWDDRKLAKFFAYCAAEEKQRGRTNYYHAVIAAGRCVGVVGVHPAAYDRRGRFFVTVFLSARHAGRGIGTAAVTAALSDFWGRRPGTPVYADVRADNYPMQRVAEKAGFVKIKGLVIGKRSYLRFAALGR